jgi:hypothetical protein
VPVFNKIAAYDSQKKNHQDAVFGLEDCHKEMSMATTILW